MEHFDAEKVGIQVAKEAWHTDRSVEQKMHGALHQLSSEGIGRAIYLVRPEMEDGEQAELIGLAVPCGTLDASTDMEVSVAFVTGDVYTVKPSGKPGARAKFNATFMPSEHPETVHYPNAASAQHGLMYRDLPHDKKKMKASTVPTQARKVVKTFLSAIEYARALRDNNDENRGKIVGLTALMAFKNHDSDGAVSAAQLEFVPE